MGAGSFSPDRPENNVRDVTNGLWPGRNSGLEVVDPPTGLGECCIGARPCCAAQDQSQLRASLHNVRNTQTSLNGRIQLQSVVGATTDQADLHMVNPLHLDL
eukprot:scaffold248726_cov22-Tisochrysis_lutea.AAC.1